MYRHILSSWELELQPMNFGGQNSTCVHPLNTQRCFYLHTGVLPQNGFHSLLKNLVATQAYGTFSSKVTFRKSSVNENSLHWTGIVVVLLLLWLIKEIAQI